MNLAMHIPWLLLMLVGPAIGAPVPQPQTSNRVAPEPPAFVDLHLDRTGRVGACSARVAFRPLTALPKPSARLVHVRGRVWLPATRTCTASMPEHCIAYPVLARSRPTARSPRGIVLLGQLTPDTPFACTGTRGALECPIPIDGREYGLTGVLERDEAGQLSLQLRSVCRIRPGARR